MTTNIGSRHRCATCGAEVIVTADPAATTLEITCCGAPLDVIFTKEGGPTDPGSTKPGSS